MTSQFGALLRQIRRRAGLTQEQLADRAGLGVRTIRGFETGERAEPRLATVRLLAEALELEPAERDELLGAAAGTVPSEEPPPPPPEPDPLADTVDQLAHTVRSRWRREEEQRQIQDPFPLPVRWQLAPEQLTDHWPNIRRAPAGDSAGPLALSGRLDAVVEVYRRVPSGRLVVLGRAGSGKTILALRFVLDLLATRERADPVPVVFGLGSWNPATGSLRDWLIEQLLRDFPGLAAPGPGGAPLAAALVEAGRILPVLDGFDELAAGLRPAALRALNATTLPLLLTSRPDEYAAAVAGTDVLTSAAAIELTDLTVTDLANYLPRTARKNTTPETGWDPVLRRLREQPDDPAGANLAMVLRTPLMITLARAIYSDAPGRDPAALLDTARFPTPEALEAHLFDNFIPTVYREHDDQREYEPDRARQWLGFLARHLDRLGTHDLAWWQLGDAVRRSTAMLVIAVVVGLAAGSLEWLVAGLLNVLSGDSAKEAFSGFRLVDALIVGGTAGVAFGLVHGLLLRLRRAVFEPSRTRVRLIGGTRPARRGGFPARFRMGLTGGLVFGLGFGLMLGLLAWVGTGQIEWLQIGLVDALVWGLSFGPAAGLIYGLMAWLEAPLELSSAASPAELLKTNRSLVLLQLLVFAPLFGVTVALGGTLVVSLLEGAFGPLRFTPPSAPLWGIVGALAGGLGYALSLTAWGRWVVFARIWLPLTGKLPPSVLDFLDDAYRRGVLRRSGAVYQFRHARLRDHLSQERQP